MCPVAPVHGGVDGGVILADAASSLAGTVWITPVNRAGGQVKVCTGPGPGKRGAVAPPTL